MPGTGQPGDDGQGAGAENGTEDGKQAGQQSGQSQQQARTFTQEEVDRIVQERVRRATPADYADLQKLKEQHDAAEEAKKSELEKAQAKATAAETKAAEAIAKANRTLRRAAILAAAAAANAADADTIAVLLESSEDVTVDEDGTVKGAKKAVADLLKEKPFLAGQSGGGTPSRSGTAFGGQEPQGGAQTAASLRQKAQDPTLTARARSELLAQARSIELNAYAQQQLGSTEQ